MQLEREERHRIKRMMRGHPPDPDPDHMPEERMSKFEPIMPDMGAMGMSYDVAYA